MCHQSRAPPQRQVRSRGWLSLLVSKLDARRIGWREPLDAPETVVLGAGVLTPSEGGESLNLVKAEGEDSLLLALPLRPKKPIAAAAPTCCCCLRLLLTLLLLLDLGDIRGEGQEKAMQKGVDTLSRKAGSSNAIGPCKKLKSQLSPVTSLKSICQGWEECLQKHAPPGLHAATWRPMRCSICSKVTRARKNRRELPFSIKV